MGYKKNNYQKNTNLVASASFPQHPPVTRVKTDGRIGSVTHPTKTGMVVNNNQSAQSHSGGLGAVAAKHMSPGARVEAWSPRVTKARAQLTKGPSRPHAHPVNHTAGNVKKVKPN